MIKWILRLFKERQQLTPTYEMMLYQGEHGYHDGDWGRR